MGPEGEDTPLLQEAAEQLRRLWRTWQRTSHPAKKGAVSVEQYLVLRTLDRQGPLPVSQVAARLGTTVSAATILTQRMQRQGLVYRRRQGEDSRVVEVGLLPVGQETMAAWERQRQEGLMGLLSALPEEDLAQLVRILGHLDP